MSPATRTTPTFPPEKYWSGALNCETPLFPNRPDRSASLRLPKLSISGTYDLKSVLSKMGITKVFSAEADLSETLRKGPSVSSLQAMHKAMLSIDENVTEYSGHLSILFNWPFLVIIKDENTNIPLFMGKMVNPMQK
uniref:Serpin domain-containing protein n=1 Tax=Canis lupus familiaris TaxID=9615 RepID=A0A8I3RR27_CANLF